jgi:hypothetical protein
MRPLYGQSLVYWSQSVLRHQGLLKAGRSLICRRRTQQPCLLNTPTALTGKERLSKKWMDEQRIDNCNVPIDKRGTKPQSSTRA